MSRHAPWPAAPLRPGGLWAAVAPARSENEQGGDSAAVVAMARASQARDVTHAPPLLPMQPVVFEPGSLAPGVEHLLTAWTFSGDLDGEYLLSNPQPAPSIIVGPAV